jgi:hypothetical protein
MRVSERYPIKGEVLRGDSVRLDAGPGAKQMGILLNTHDDAIDWLDVTYTSEFLKYNYIPGGDRQNRSQNTRVIETGTSGAVGRDASFGSRYVSGEHLHIDCRSEVYRKAGKTVIERFVEFKDVSTNGTSLWYPNMLDEEDTPQDDNVGMNEEPMNETNSGETGLPEIDELANRYKSEFKELEYIDFGILHNIIKSHPKPFLSRKDKMTVISLIHPDRNLTGDENRNHQLYIVANRILGL